MQIDWFTFIAQIINFLILVVLLWRFLYKPIVKAMDEREENIEARFDEAEENRKKAEQEAESYRNKRKEFEDKRDEMFAQAEEESEAHRKELIDEARQDVDEMKAKWHESIEREKNSFLKDLRQRASAQIYTAARNALADLANEELEQQIIDVFIERIEKLDEEKRETIVESIQDSNQGVLIRSTFEITEEKRQQIIDVVKSQLTDDLTLNLETSADLICGIELKAGGHKVAWNLENYLGNLEENLSKVIEEETETSEEENEAEEKED